ncbi:MAG TPA: hypothetical protein VI731_09485, partial [Bacteroidia bacterium]|nr:hypothetical protein [Bacteroidia bacterium]
MRLSPRTEVLILLLLVIISRLPFLPDGFGHEEDSWGLVVNSFQMKETGHYVASRFPGHPLQEYAYRIIYDRPAWAYNSMSLFMSAVAVAFFYLSLKKLQVQQAFMPSLFFTFVPAFFIAGTYTIDFAWGLAFVLASFYFLLDRKLLISGLLIGMAAGCRITSEIFLLPWAILLFNRLDFRVWIKDCLLLVLPAVCIGIAWYIPAYLNYETDFFDYSDQFPYPPLAKVIYKATIGVFGFTGLCGLVFFIFPALVAWRKKELQPVTHVSPGKLIFVCVLIFLLFTIAYLRLPQKSGYMIPIIPWVAIFFAITLRRKYFRILTTLMVLSPFLFSINLTDPLRGANHSRLAMTFVLSGQEIFIDPLSGPVFSEQSKRRNKMNYCNNVLREMRKPENKHAFVIGGW